MSNPKPFILVGIPITAKREILHFLMPSRQGSAFLVQYIPVIAGGLRKSQKERNLNINNKRNCHLRRNPCRDFILLSGLKKEKVKHRDLVIVLLSINLVFEENILSLILAFFP